MFQPNKRINKNQDLFVTKSLSKIHENKYKQSWMENSILLNPINLGKIKTYFSFFRINTLFLFFFILFSVIIIRLAWLQLINGEHYYAQAQGNRIRLERIESKRGIIYDKNKRPLVRNVPNFMLYFVPADLPRDKIEKTEILLKISSLLKEKLTISDLEEKLAIIKPRSLASFRPLFIQDNIPYDAAMSLMLESKKWPGVILSSKTRREYNLTSLSMSHVLGYTGKINDYELNKFGEDYYPIDYIGKVGVEYFWESELRGFNGQKQIEVDALGKEKRIIKEIYPQNGSHLVLSLDIQLQKKIEEIAQEYLKDLDTQKAIIVAINPINGSIMAMVNIPSYNNNAFARGITQVEYQALINHPDKPLFNRAITGEYPSGSTIKPVMVAAALQENIITEHTTFLSTGGIRISSWYFPDWKAGGHGYTNARKAIAESVNTFFYYIGGGHKDFQGLGVKKIVHYGKLFGLSEQTGVDMAGESRGFLPSKEWKKKVKNERWYIGDTYHLAIGQGDIMVTPLQVALFTSVFANGGKLFRPHLVEEIISANDQSTRRIDVSPIRHGFIDSYNIVVVRQGMRQAVTSGSARKLSTLPIEAAGKTGTAQWSSKKETHAWFTGFAPYVNPKMVLTILVEEGGEGSETAVPMAYDIWNWYFRESKKTDH